MKPTFKLVTFAFLMLFSVALVGSLPVNAADDQADAAPAISAAQTSLRNCYLQTQKAEAQGANVTTLISTLNQADTLLTSAQAAYARNDFQTANDLAQQTQNQLSKFTTEETSLTASANQKSNSNALGLAAAVAGSAGGLVVGFAAWAILNRRDRLGGQKR
jgi:Trk-type K+ transport system membrane component